MSQYEIMVSHGLTFASACAAVLKGSGRFGAPISLYCKAKQKDIDSINLPAVSQSVVCFLILSSTIFIFSERLQQSVQFQNKEK